MKASIDSPRGLALRNPQSRARRVLRNPKGGGGPALRNPKRERGHVLRSSQSGGGHVLRSSQSGGGHVLRSSQSGAGFTLVEMLAVMAVIGIMFTVAVVGFSRFGRGARLRSAGRLIGQQLDLARQQALTRNAMYGVEFDKGDPQSYRIYYKDPEISDVEECPTVGKWIELPPGVEFGNNKQPTEEMPPNEIEFKPTGSTVQPSVEFKIHDTETRKERLIKVVQITGHTEVTVPE